MAASCKVLQIFKSRGISSKITQISQGLQSVRIIDGQRFCSRALSTNDAPETAEPNQPSNDPMKAAKISKAMQAYLMRAREHDKMLKTHNEEFERGKQHLARMMDLDPDHLTQEEIDKAIEYLLPSGLFAKRARPIMKPAEYIFQRRKSAEFDESGRPFHHLFYTARPNYYQLMHDINERRVKLHSLDKSSAKSLEMDADAKAVNDSMIHGMTWLSLNELKETILEDIGEHEYRRFTLLMELLMSHPLAYTEKDFIVQYRVPLVDNQMLVQIAEINVDEQTDRRFTTASGKRKHADAEVTVMENGTGKITINKEFGLEYFEGIYEREQVLSPLSLTNSLGDVDVECTVSGPGTQAQAGAIRYALSLCLAAFQSRSDQEKMRQAGLLTHDPRRRERKKPGLKKARKRKTWKKR